MGKYLIIILVLFVASCSNKKSDYEGVQTIELKESKDFLPISSFISDLEYLELHVSEANIEIGEIQDIKIFGSDMIIKQRKAGEISFIRFTKKGEFINEIVNNTKGKIAQPLDIIPYNKDYAILGENGIHVVAKNGEYKGKLISSEIGGTTFFAVKNKFLVINESPSEDFLLEYSKKGKAPKVNRLDERLNRLIYTNLQTVGKNNSHLLSSFSDIIYSYSNNKLQPRYKLDAGTCPTLSKVWEGVGDRDAKETMRYIYDSQHVLVKNYLENDEMIFITYWVGSHSTTAIIDKELWKTRYYARGVNDIDGGIWDKALYMSDKNELFVPISAYKIGGHKISNKRHHDFEELQLHIAASGNPVIMKCSLD